MKDPNINRRAFLTAASSAGILAASPIEVSAQKPAAGRQYLLLQKYSFQKEEQRQGFNAIAKEVLLPALNRLGVQPVGAFSEPKEAQPVYILLPFSDAESALTLNQRLLADSDFSAKGMPLIDVSKADAPYKEMESWLMLSFKNMPKVEVPAKGPNRVFQLRTYESPSVKAGQKKIEMFNDAGEIRIFREVGLNPVFFGEVIVGSKMPNLTYMLGFNDPDQLKAAWGKFGGHPDWQKISRMPEYTNERIIRGITNIQLNPTEYSQI